MNESACFTTPSASLGVIIFANLGWFCRQTFASCFNVHSFDNLEEGVSFQLLGIVHFCLLTVPFFPPFSFWSLQVFSCCIRSLPRTERFDTSHNPLFLHLFFNALLPCKALSQHLHHLQGPMRAPLSLKSLPLLAPISIFLFLPTWFSKVRLSQRGYAFRIMWMALEWFMASHLSWEPGCPLHEHQTWHLEVVYK